MKIALMTNNYRPFIGGVPISIERLKNALMEQGHEVLVFAPQYDNAQEDSSVFRYGIRLKHFIGGTVLPNPMDKRIEKVFKEQHFDVIHVHHPMLIGRTAVYLSNKYHIPLVFTYHTRYEQYLCYLPGFRFLENRAKKGGRISNAILSFIQEKMVPLYLRIFLYKCNTIITPTLGLQDYLLKQCKVKADKLAVLPTGIESSSFSVTQEEKNQIREQYDAENIPLFVSVSRMAHEKNVEFLLNSIARVSKQYENLFRVLLIGDGPNKCEYERLCEKLGISSIVKFVGTIENNQLAPYFAAADAFLFASKTETQGIVILEALAGGTPVYAVDATGVRDLIKSGYNGFLTVEEEEKFASKVLDFLNHKDDRKTLSMKALETALSYKEETVAGSAIQIYNRAIANYSAKKVYRDEGVYGKQISYFGSGR